MHRDMMSFLLLLLEWKDFTKEQIISFQIVGGIMGTIGALLGGILGDYFAQHSYGRVGVAIFSVLSGIIFYGLFLFAETYSICIICYGLFHLTGGWCPGKSALVSLYHMISCVRYEDSAIWILHLAFISHYLTVFEPHVLT